MLISVSLAFIGKRGFFSWLGHSYKKFKKIRKILISSVKKKKTMSLKVS